MKGFNCDEAIVTSEELCSHIDEVIDKKIAVLESAITARLEKTVENGVENGVRAALARMGFRDNDMFELANMLSSYRMLKNEAGRAIVGWVMKGIAFVIILGIAIKSGYINIAWPK